jgi:hypothetical protein
MRPALFACVVARLEAGHPSRIDVGALTPPPRRNVRKVFIRFELDLDFGFWVIGKVLILLGFGVGDVGKVFISNK